MVCNSIHPGKRYHYKTYALGADQSSFHPAHVGIQACYFEEKHRPPRPAGARLSVFVGAIESGASDDVTGHGTEHIGKGELVR